ncbi:MAG TPA: ABC transporter permease [Candidatus Eremiobacteraceae bacterium]|nr:ABC transporter permease [Candidatus Eremiobacteraceae bacterium]
MQYLVHHVGLVLQLTWAHMLLVGCALAIALLIAAPISVFITRRRRFEPLVLGVFGVIYTIPSLALFAFLIPVLGLGFWTAVVALAAYAQMILIRNFSAALLSVDPAVREAAYGMGMDSLQALWRVERPLAMPIAIAGVRLAAVSLIGIATVAAWINAGGIGTLVLDGIQHDYPQKAVAGALAAVALALAVDFSLRRVEAAYRRHLTPR